MDENKKIKLHKSIYQGFLILGLVGIIEMATKSIVSQMYGINAEVGFIGLILINITRNRIILSIAPVILDFSIFWIIIALLERQTWIKLKNKNNEEKQKPEEQTIKSNKKINYKKRIFIAIALIVVFVVALIYF